MSRKAIFLALWLAAAIALLVLLFRLLGITLADLGRTLAATPAWLLAAVFALTLLNQLASVARWRAAAAWLSPDMPRMSFIAMLEATTWGALLGQVVPPQLSMPMARWAAARNGSAVGVTLYEGLFDFVVLTSGALAALAVFVLGLETSASVLLFGLAILLGCLSIRWIMAAGHVLTARLAATHLPGARLAERFSAPFARANRAPARILAVLSAWSFVRMALLSLRTVLIVVAFLASINWATLVIGYPLVGLAMSVPVLPAGLGLAEWSWTGLLVLAGATAPTAAVIAVTFRIVNFAGLCAVMLALLPLRLQASRPLTQREAPHG